MKTELRGKPIAMSHFPVPQRKKKMGRAYTISLTAHLNALEQKEENTPKWSTQQEIINLRTEINQVETKRSTWKPTKPRVGSLRKSKGDIRTETGNAKIFLDLTTEAYTQQN